MVNLLKPSENPFVKGPSSHPESEISAEPADSFGDRFDLFSDLLPSIARLLAHRAEDHRGDGSRPLQQISRHG